MYNGVPVERSAVLLSLFFFSFSSYLQVFVVSLLNAGKNVIIISNFRLNQVVAARLFAFSNLSAFCFYSFLKNTNFLGDTIYKDNGAR